MTLNEKQKPFEVKIPSDLVERLALKQGDRVSVALDTEGKLVLKNAGSGTTTRIPSKKPSLKSRAQSKEDSKSASLPPTQRGAV